MVAADEREHHPVRPGRGGEPPDQPGRPQLRPHARPCAGDRGPLRPAPRGGRRHRSRLRRRAGRRARPHRPSGWPSTAGWWPATGCPTACPPGPTPTSWSQLMGRDKKARQGLTFVFDGPRGVEAGDGRAPGCARPGLRRPRRGRRRPAPLRHDPAALRPEPEPSRSAGARRLRAGDAGGARGPGPGGRPPPTVTHLEHLQSNREGDLIEAVHAGPWPLRRDRDQPRGLHPLRLGPARRARRLRRPGGRAAPLQPQPPRALATHVGGVAGRDGHDLRVRRRRLRAGGRGPGPPPRRERCARRGGRACRETTSGASGGRP